MSQRRRTFVLANGTSVELVRAGDPFRSGRLDGHQWPCLGCGNRRPIADARTVVVREHSQPPMRRHILLCQPCLDGTPAPGADQPEPV